MKAKMVKGFDDNYTGYVFENLEDMIKCATKFDNISVPIKVVFLESAWTDGRSEFKIYVLQPRKGIPLVYSFTGFADVESFYEVLKSVAQFFNRTSIRYGNLGDREYIWHLDERYTYLEENEIQVFGKVEEE